MNCLYRESSWFLLMSKVCSQTYPWRSVSTWRLTTSPRATLISSLLKLNSETFLILPLLKHISCLRVRFLIKLMGWQWALPLPQWWLIFSWVTMKGFGWKTIRPPVFYFTDVMLTILFVYLTLNMTPLCFLTTSTTDIPTYISPWKKKWMEKSPFWMF